MKLVTFPLLVLFLSLSACGGGGSSTPDDEMDPLAEDPQQPTPGPTASEFGREWNISPYEHSNPELALSAPGIQSSEDPKINRPLLYERVFDRERELHDYNPRFLPGRPYFDKNNLPWIYVNNQNQLGGADPQYPEHVSPTTDQPTGKALHAVTYDDRVYMNRYTDANPCPRCGQYILRLTPDGKWVSLSIDAMSEEFGFDMTPQGMDNQTRYRRIEQVYFQNNGDVFVKADHGLLRYRHADNSWIGYPRRWIGRSELVGDGKQPPLFLNVNRPELSKYTVQRLINQGDGELSWENSEILHGEKLNLYFGNQSAVLVGDELHIAAFNWSDTINGRQDHNSAQTYVRHNLVTGATNTLFMGWSGSPSQRGPDNHNEPIILVDSQGYVHFISGAHGHQIWHRKSLLNVTSAEWNLSGSAWGNEIRAHDKFSPGPETPMAQHSENSPLELGVDYIGGMSMEITYPHARIDSRDNIHLVVREESPDGSEAWASKRRLYYIKGSPSGQGSYQWESKGNLVVPDWASYSNYKQKVNVDRQDRIYVTYMYEIQNFMPIHWYNSSTLQRFESSSSCADASNMDDCVNIYQEHNRRWPDEELVEVLPGTNWGLVQDFTHDPVVVGSSDGGNSWSITTTQEFLNRKQDVNLGNVVGY